MGVRKIKLSAPQFIPPDVIRAAERQVETTVIDEKGVFVNGHLLRSEEAPLELGKVARVFLWNGWLYLSYVYEIEANNEDQRIKYENAAREKQEAFIQECFNFWSIYDIPFKFTVEIKERLSGLSANSGGNGHARNTVYHIFVKEDIKIGRSPLKPGSFLCSPVKSKHGANWSGSLGDGRQHGDINPPVTCKACLKKLDKFLK